MTTTLQISSRGLLALDGLEQRLEITFAKAFRALALDDLVKERRPVLHWLAKNLQQITFVIAIDQNAQSLQRVQLFVDVPNAIQQRVIIGRRNVQELDSALLQI